MDESCLWINGSKISLKVHHLAKLPLRKFYNPNFLIQNPAGDFSAKHQIANHYRDFKLQPNLKLQCVHLARHLRNVRNKSVSVSPICYRLGKDQRQQLPTAVCFLSSHVSQSGNTLIPYNDTVRRILNASDDYELLKQLTERYLSRIRGKLYRSSLASNVKPGRGKGTINYCHNNSRNCRRTISKNLDIEAKYGSAIWNYCDSINAVEFVNDYHDLKGLENRKHCESVDKQNQLEQQQIEQQSNYQLEARHLEETNAVEESFHDSFHEGDYHTQFPFSIETQIRNQNDIITKSSKSFTATPARTTTSEPTISINTSRDRIGRSTRANNTEASRRSQPMPNTTNKQQIRSKVNPLPLKSSLGKVIRDQQTKDQNQASNTASEPSAVQLIRVEIKQIVLNEKRKQ